MKSRIGWGILGAGNIANRFVSGFKDNDDGFLVAVGSKTSGKAEAFTAKYGGKPYTSYEEMLSDDNVDVVYIATPHTLHLEHTLLAMSYGKPVLCEKPMAPNVSQAKKIVETARSKNLYAMEAMWTRFFPTMVKVREWLASGEIGKIHLVTADFGFMAQENPTSRLFSPDLAGGSLLDVGIYTLSFAFMVYGKKPNRIASMHDAAVTGVDSRMGCILGYKDGGMASLFSAIRTPTPHEARIVGENGHIIIPRFWHPQKAILFRKGQQTDEFTCDYQAEGFQFEMKAVQDDLRAGRKENAVMPLDESVEIAETMDKIRSQWGLIYPFEKGGAKNG